MESLNSVSFCKLFRSHNFLLTEPDQRYGGNIFCAFEGNSYRAPPGFRSGYYTLRRCGGVYFRQRTCGIGGNRQHCQ